VSKIAAFVRGQQRCSTAVALQAFFWTIFGAKPLE